MRLAAEFGSLASWTKDFRATGMIRGTGWVALVWDPTSDRFHNVWIDGNDGGHLAGCPLILLLDAFEHAYLTDYGAKRGRYFDACLAAVDWSVAESRFAAAQASVLVPAGP